MNVILQYSFKAYPALFRSLPVLTNQGPSRAPASCRSSAAGGHHTAFTLDAHKTCWASVMRIDTGFQVPC